MEFVPMSMAARRMRKSQAGRADERRWRGNRWAASHGRYILPEQSSRPMPPTSQNGRHPITIRPKPPVTMMLLLRRAHDLEGHLPAAIAGDDAGVHQARVASRRLREAVPVLAADTKVRRKAERKIRRVTQALGTVRE